MSDKGSVRGTDPEMQRRDADQQHLLSASSPLSLSASSPLSPRRRRLRVTAAALSVLAVLAVCLGVVIYFKTRPAQYRPDEQSSDITSELARGLPTDAPKPQFSDVTREAGLAAFRNFAGNRTSQLPEDMGPGVAWGDFNNDGYDDLFLVSAGGSLNLPPEKLLPCELYENLGDGTFRKVEGFPDTRIHGMAAAWGDYDGDGFLDLIVTGYNALLLFHNEGGTGKFTRDTRLPNLKGYWAGASWGDYDHDRALDLYVCGYVQYIENDADRARISQQIGTAVPYTLNPVSYLPGTNLLFHNHGDGTFTEVAAALKVQDPEGRSLGALWHDFDDDGWLDLYVANDVSDNVFYHNTGGTFEDISHAANVADYRSAMGLAAGDYDRDGDDDLFIGHWVAQENALYENLWADYNAKQGPGSGSNGVARQGRVGVMENGNNGMTPPMPSSAPPALQSSITPSLQSSNTPSLQHSPAPSLQNSNTPPRYPLRFMDIADMKGLGQIALPYVSWGAEFADFDGDGWLDLVVANGNTLEADGPAPRELKQQECFLFWNRRGEFFHNLAPLNKSLSAPHNNRGLALADYDNDGDLDIVIAQLGEGVQLLRNDMQTGHWLKVRLRSLNQRGQPLGFGDGTRLIAHLDDVVLRRAVSSVSYLSQSSRQIHFGLGAAAAVDQLEVRWHAGETNFFNHLDANATYEITEGSPTLKKIEARKRAAGNEPTDKSRLVEFWNKQRAAMNAMKVEKDDAKAIALFGEALALNPAHEDSHYYLSLCLAALGDGQAALTQLDELKRLNPQSHRAFQQWGVLRATFAQTPADLAAAEQSLEQARALNPEETGALLVLGEISLLRGDLAKADERLTAACQTNPRAVGGFFLRAYLASKRGDNPAATRLLEDARRAFGKDWQPKGATSEGDVKQKQHLESTPLTRFWESWDGSATPPHAFDQIEEYFRAIAHR